MINYIDFKGIINKWEIESRNKTLVSPCIKLH